MPARPSGLDMLLCVDPPTKSCSTRRRAWGALHFLTSVVLLALSGCLAGTGGARVASQPGRSAPAAPTPTDPLREETVYDAQQLAELPDKHTVGVLNARGLGDVALSHLDGFDQLRSLTLAGGGKDLTDAGLVHVARLRTLRDLSLEETSITDEGLGLLRPLDQLVRLDLSATHVTGEGLEGFSSLRELVLSNNTHVNDEGFKRVGGLRGLRVLDVSLTWVSDADLESLAGLTELLELRLDGAIVTGVGLRHLGRMTKIRRLSLWGCTVDDDSLAAIPRLDQLRELDLSDSEVTDAGLRHLRGLKHLKRVWLVRCKVTPWGEAELQKALPGLEVNPHSPLGEVEELTLMLPEAVSGHARPSRETEAV